ncbi:MAG: hypothetical protein KGD59_04445 [Candidatus Heimdallarchaeota archaeon]|nr:hypothetical protein [Candidatus Heimdallarchaeota archaeon]MBY8993776.1 hypothetical protein [Candidatus Heimdallarchaeota archaeon]
MTENLKSNLTFFKQDRVFLSIFFIILFFGFSLGKISTQSFVHDDIENFTTDVTEVVRTDTTVPFDVVFVGYNEDFVNTSMISDSLDSTAFYPAIDYIFNEDTQEYDYVHELEITLNFDFHFASPSYSAALDSFVDTNSWNSNTSALNVTQLNLQEATGERKSIFYDQEGRAIDGEAIDQYLDANRGFVSDEPSYVIYFLNQSRFDSSDHSNEHWFEVDEVDPDSNITADWFRLEWDNDLNSDVEYPYPCWGHQNRLFFIDPYSHQWYTKWTNIWWNPDIAEGDIDYLTVDLDTYLEGYTPGTPDFTNNLNEYLSDYLNDIASDVGARGDGLLYNEKEVSSQVLFINDEANHGYSKEDLEWIYSEDILAEAFEYVVPNEVANITLEDTWVELSDRADLSQIVNDNKLGAAEIGGYPWYNPDWTYLDGIEIFYAFESIASNYFDLDKGDSTFTSWILLIQNVSMISYAYGEYREFTGLGGGGNVVCYKDLNRYYYPNGTTPRSGVTTLLSHELGHVLGFMHAEITNDADEGPGGFMRDVMSYYSEGTPYFSVFLKDSLYRTSSFVVYHRNKPAIDAYRINPLHDPATLALIDDVISDAEAAMDVMDYLEAFLIYRELYDLTANLNELTPTSSATFFTALPVILLLFPISILIIWQRKRK